MKGRVIRGSFWLGFGGGTDYCLRFLRNIILARILAPEAFGLMAIILAVNAALEAFTQIGLKEAVIQSPDGEKNTYLNATWWLSFVRSIGLFSVAMIGASWVTSFYDVSQHTIMFRISFVSILFNGAFNARAYVTQKKMDFKRWMIILNGGSVVGVLVAIGLSLWLQNIWALIIGFVIESLAKCILSFIMCPFVPRLHFKQGHTRALLTFARGIFGLPILFFVFTQTDIFVVGKLLSKKELGLYSMAISLSQVPLYLVTTILNPILMPSFSEKQHDKEWINHVLIQSTKFIAFMGTPIACFFAFYGKDVLTIVYGLGYSSVALPFAILLFSTLLRAVGTPIANLYLATGKPQLQRFFSIIRAVVILILIYPAVKFFGLTGAASAGLLAMLISYYFQVKQIRSLTNLNVRQYGFTLVRAMMISLPVVAIWSITYLASPIFSNGVLWGLIGCISVYGLIVWFVLKFKVRDITIKEFILTKNQ